jgi:anhydro-N-acetylmuramic acid kinase
MIERNAPSQFDRDRRWLVGVLVSSKCDRATASLVGVQGRGLTARADIIGAARRDIPGEITGLFNALANATPCAVTSLASLRTQLAQHEAAVVHELLKSQNMPPAKILAAGIHDPGIWEFARGEPVGYLSLCDPAQLAETTGLNVIDAFPARDLAVGGLGGPIGALAAWLLLGEPLRNRVLLDLGRTVRLTYLPAFRRERSDERILAFEVGPGSSLLDRLAQQLTGGQHRCDIGGRLAVQGHRIEELADHWLRDSYFDCPPPRWHPRGVKPERFLADATHMAMAADWSVRNMLCTATHFIAEMVARTLTRRLPEDAMIDEVLITGGARHNGMLLREIGRLTGLPLVQVSDLPIPDDALESATIAMLAALHVDETPANRPSITKAREPRLLGRLTAGTPQSFQLLLESCNGNLAVRPLRVAV